MTASIAPITPGGSVDRPAEATARSAAPSGFAELLAGADLTLTVGQYVAATAGGAPGVGVPLARAAVPRAADVRFGAVGAGIGAAAWLARPVRGAAAVPA